MWLDEIPNEHCTVAPVVPVSSTINHQRFHNSSSEKYPDRPSIYGVPFTFNYIPLT